MKKYKIFVLTMLIALISFVGVNATTIDDSYSYTTYDNEGYDLINGDPLENENMSRTNRVEIARNSIDDKIYFNDDNFSHILFFNSSNIYIGYGNGNGSTRELSSYIGDLIPDGADFYIEVPENARKFALMNYNYGAHFRDDIIYENEDIDNIAIYGLSYRDLFEGNDNFFLNSTFETTTNWNSNVNRSIVNDELVLTPYGNADYIYTYNDLSTNALSISKNSIYYTSFDTLFPESFTNAHVSTSPYPFSYPPFDNPLLVYPDNITEMATFKGAFTAHEDSDYIYYNYFKDSIITVDEIVYFDNAFLYDLTDIFNADFSEWPTINLFDRTTANEAYLLDLGTGDLTANAGFFSSDYISVIVGEDYVFNYYRATTGTGVVFYDDNYNFVSSLSITAIGSASTFIIPSGVSYIRLAHNYDDGAGNTDILPTFQIELGDVSTSYVTHVDYDSLITDFEAMKLYYDTYKGAVDEISYNDIFENNLILNHDFSTPDLYWSATLGNGGRTIVNGEMIINNDYNYGRIQYTPLAPDIAHDYYYSADYITWTDNWSHFGIVNAESSYILNEWTTQQGLATDLTSFRFYVYDTSQFDDLNEYVYIDNIFIYDLTSIFGYVEDDITATWIEARYDEWVDPLANDYPNYYPASTLILNTVYYKYDDTPPAPADFQTSFDDKLVSIGVDTPQEELFGAFLIMIIVAVLLGLKFKSVAIVMIAELSLIFIFTVLGWFSLWFILVLALTFVLLILLKALKGGQK